MNGKRQDLRYREVPKPYSLYLYDAKIGPFEDKELLRNSLLEG